MLCGVEGDYDQHSPTLYEAIIVLGDALLIDLGGMLMVLLASLGLLLRRPGTVPHRGLPWS